MSEAAVATPKTANGITKIAAVKEATEKLGKDATRADLQAFVKKQFGFEMTLDHISNYKNKLQHKTSKGKAKKPVSSHPAAVAAKAKGTQPAAPKTAAPKTTSPKPPMPKVEAKKDNGAGIGLEDIQVAKELIGRVGPQQLRSLVDLLAK